MARSEATKQSSAPCVAPGLLRGACHRAGIRPTRWLTMTLRRRGSAFSRHDVSEVFKVTPPHKEEGAGKTGCALHPRSHVQCASKESAHEQTGSAETLRPSLRNGFTAYIVLSLVNRSLLPPSPPRGRTQACALVHAPLASTAARPNVSDEGLTPLFRDRMHTKSR
jgi:hypothetical protein